MPTAEPIVPTLLRRWGLPDEAADRSINTDSAFSLCRWRHVTPEIPDGELPANAFVLTRSEGRCYRHRGRAREATPARRGALGLLAAGSYGRWIFPTASDNPVEVLHLYFPPAYLDKLAVQSGMGSRVELKDRLEFQDHLLQGVARAIDNALNAPAPDRLLVEGLSLAVAARLISAHSTGAVRHPERGGLAPWQLKRACDAMEGGLRTGIGLSALADVAGCSPTHFSRAFKRSMGVPPFQWLLERRIERAKQLLDERTLPLAEIAQAVGFSAQAQFTTSFKRVVGITPGAWRRERLV